MKAQTLTQPPAARPVSCFPRLVLGLGNLLLRDEGVGVHVVRAMQDIDLPADVEVFDGATAGLDLLDVLADRRHVVVVDAMDGPFEPGAVLRLRPEDVLPQQAPRVSLHEVGLLETLAVARQLGIAPQDVVIIGIKPFELTCGLELSSEMSQRVPWIIELALNELREQGTGHEA